MFDVIAIGDITLDVFLNIKNAELTCDINEEDCKLCVGFGDKIPIENVTEVYGVGNAPNVAVGLSRLGLKAALYSHLGDDAVADKTIDTEAAMEVIVALRSKSQRSLPFSFVLESRYITSKG